MPNLKEVIEAQNQPFKYAAFSGGGAKGAIYSGVHEELVRSGTLAGMEALAGSSAGAISAALIATGISSEQFKKISSETNLPNLLGEGFIINKDGKPLYELLHNTINANVIDYLEKNNALNAAGERLSFIEEKINNLTQQNTSEATEEIEILSKQKQKLQQVINSNGESLNNLLKNARDNGKITFGDLDLLHIIDPVRFKDLVITATNRETGELTLFDARKTPGVEIALACRASASIPLVFEPVTIDGVQYVDGGYRNNIPQNHFEGMENDAKDITESQKEIEQAKSKGRTLALAFGSDNNSNAHIAVYSAAKKILNPSAITRFLVDVVFKFVSKTGGKFKHTEDKEKTYQGLRDNALNTVILDTKDVGTLSFKAAQEKAEYLHVKGSIQTSRHFENHGIGNNPDANLDSREFILKAYEESQNKGIIDKWKDKIIGGKQEKMASLLSFAKPEIWNEKDSKEVLKSFIKSAATSRHSGDLVPNTVSIKKIVTLLNEPTTPDKVKQSFMEALDIKLEKGVKIKDYKFGEKNITNFIANNAKANARDDKLVIQNKKSDMRKAINDIKEIINKDNISNSISSATVNKKKSITRSNTL